jgi:coenzyme F420-0:L-glutamate ligase
VTIEIRPVEGMGEIRPGDDLAAAILDCAPWIEDGDILVVTSKIVSKAEGRLVKVEGITDTEREADRQAAVASETVRVVASRGTLRIVENRLGLVMAAAGVDASNVARDEIALLPLDPDVSAARLRDAVHDRTGRTVAVIITDSVGRPWRGGITDIAIGAAGIATLLDERGEKDRHGNVLAVTQVAIGDEIAAAGDLVKGKLSDVPVAVVRGLAHDDDGRGARRLIRLEGDMFSLGTAEALALGRAQATTGEEPGESVQRLHADVQATLVNMGLDAGAGDGQAAVREGFYALLAARPDATRRACVPGHITASTLVLDANAEHVLLTLHPRVKAWLQLGGHVEDDDTSLLEAARREALEESGIEGITIDPIPIDLDIHPITCSLGLPTRHFDVRFVGHAPAGAQPVISDESDDLRWFAVDALPDLIAPELPRLIARAVERSRSHRRRHEHARPDGAQP